MTFDSGTTDESHRVDILVGTWLTTLLVMACLAWGGMALTALAALYTRR
jgi:hypothetical protein